MSEDDPQVTVTVHIMDREYKVSCPESERAGLLTSADYLNERMMSIRRRGKTLSAERIAVMTSLNMARELLSTKEGSASRNTDLDERMEKILSRIDATLEQD